VSEKDTETEHILTQSNTHLFNFKPAFAVVPTDKICGRS